MTCAILVKACGTLATLATVATLERRLKYDARPDDKKRAHADLNRANSDEGVGHCGRSPRSSTTRLPCWDQGDTALPTQDQRGRDHWVSAKPNRVVMQQSDKSRRTLKRVETLYPCRNTGCRVMFAGCGKRLFAGRWLAHSL